MNFNPNIFTSCNQTYYQIEPTTFWQHLVYPKLRCTTSKKCPACKDKFRKATRDYHLPSWYLDIEYYFKNKTGLKFLLKKIANKSSCDTELDMRLYYEKTYIPLIGRDYGHNYRIITLQNRSITLNKPKISNNYWKNLIYYISIEYLEVYKLINDNIDGRFNLIYSSQFYDNNISLVALHNKELNKIKQKYHLDDSFGVQHNIC